jgi:all-trans-retinol 13,14-reductase
MSWDTIVIGSGPGGLTAAVALARAGKRVLVLEQHYLPGGWTHSFTLEGHRFSPGVHYVGTLEEGGALRKLYEGLGVARDLEFVELNPNGFDHFFIGGESFHQPKGLEAWKARLVRRFPAEAAGIDQFFAAIRGINEDVCKCDTALEFPAILTVPFRVPRLLRWGFRTLRALLDATVKDPILRAVLSAQCGNHGMPPSRVSLPLHASMSTHYFDGGYYPRGGAKRIPAAFIKELRRNGGQIRVSSPVVEIVVERDRVVGVELEGGEFIRCEEIVCNADPALVYGKLLAPRYCEREMQKVAEAEYSVGTLSLFCGVAMDLGERGYDSGNYWFYRTPDVDGIYRRTLTELPRDSVDGLFLTITTLKDPGHGPPGTHTLEMFTFVPYEPFAPWGNGKSGERNDEYERLKANLAAKMLDAAEEIIPDLRRHLTFMAVGTPVTNDFYCRSHRGAIYGTAKTPWQVGPFSFSPKAPVAGLWMAGSSILSHGVAGASLSGLIAAQKILGRESTESLLVPPDGSLRVVSAEPQVHRVRSAA